MLRRGAWHPRDQMAGQFSPAGTNAPPAAPDDRASTLRPSPGTSCRRSQGDSACADHRAWSLEDGLNRMLESDGAVTAEEIDGAVASGSRKSRARTGLRQQIVPGHSLGTVGGLGDALTTQNCPSRLARPG